MALILYQKAKRIAPWPTSQENLCQIAATLPVPEFYISSDAAVFYVRNRLYRHKTKKFSNLYKQMLFDALFDKVVEMKRQGRYADMSLPRIVDAALMQPAPCCGLTPQWFYNILLRLKKQKQ